VGAPTPAIFALRHVDVGPPAPGQVQVRNEWMSIDPSMRGRMYDRKSYVPPFQLGQPLEGRAVGRVVASHAPEFAEGDIVGSGLGWREYFNAPASALTRLDTRGMPPRAFLDVAGSSGLTAYVGLFHIAGLKEGDVVFVSSAAGAVGSMVCQYAKLKGHKVIGSAGSSRKIAYLKDELGVDEAINYKAEPSLTKALARVAPDGIDVYFDNVGGSHLEAALANANRFGRFALCGMISTYNLIEPAAGPRNIMLAVTKDLNLRGFIVANHRQHEPAFLNDIEKWYSEGKIKRKETIYEGIESSVEALINLFEGAGIGKTLVKIS